MGRHLGYLLGAAPQAHRLASHPAPLAGPAGLAPRRRAARLAPIGLAGTVAATGFTLDCAVAADLPAAGAPERTGPGRTGTGPPGGDSGTAGRHHRQGDGGAQPEGNSRPVAV